MDRLKLKNSWSQVKKKLIERYPVLTEKNLEYEEGKEEQLIGNLEAKLGKTNEEVRELLRDLQS